MKIQFKGEGGGGGGGGVRCTRSQMLRHLSEESGIAQQLYIRGG